MEWSWESRDYTAYDRVVAGGGRINITRCKEQDERTLRRGAGCSQDLVLLVTWIIDDIILAQVLLAEPILLPSVPTGSTFQARLYMNHVFKLRLLPCRGWRWWKGRGSHPRLEKEYPTVCSRWISQLYGIPITSFKQFSLNTFCKNGSEFR